MLKLHDQFPSRKLTKKIDEKSWRKKLMKFQTTRSISVKKVDETIWSIFLTELTSLDVADNIIENNNAPCMFKLHDQFFRQETWSRKLMEKIDRIDVDDNMTQNTRQIVTYIIIPTNRICSFNNSSQLFFSINSSVQFTMLSY